MRISFSTDKANFQARVAVPPEGDDIAELRAARDERGLRREGWQYQGIATDERTGEQSALYETEDKAKVRPFEADCNEEAAAKLNERMRITGDVEQGYYPREVLRVTGQTRQEGVALQNAGFQYSYDYRTQAVTYTFPKPSYLHETTLLRLASFLDHMDDAARAMVAQWRQELQDRIDQEQRQQREAEERARRDLLAALSITYNAAKVRFESRNQGFTSHGQMMAESLLKRAGWRKDGIAPVRYSTANWKQAKALYEYLDADVRAIVDRLEAEHTRVLAMSLAVDAPAGGEYPLPAGLSLRGYQKVGVDFIVEHQNGVLIGDGPGTGKTPTTIVAVNKLPDVKHVLWITTATLKQQAADEWAKFTTRPELAVSLPQTDWSAQDAAANVVIINYDRVKKYRSSIDRRKWDLVICDEAHKLKNPSTTRTISVLGGEQRVVNSDTGRKELVQTPRIESDRWWFLTGTPSKNARPIEMWPLIEVCDPHGLGADADDYINRYCNEPGVPRGKGCANEVELQETMRGRFMLRRPLESVCKEMPPTTKTVIDMEMSAEMREALANERKVEAERQAAKTEAEAAVQAAQAANDAAAYAEAVRNLKQCERITIGKIAKVRHESAVAKAPAVVDFVHEELEQFDKALVFAHHKNVVSIFLQGLGVYSPVFIDGSVTGDARNAAVERFNTDPTCRVAVLSIMAAAEGLNLQHACNLAVFAEYDWSETSMTQAEGRLQRVGQTKPVFVRQCVIPGSIDSRMAKMCLDKGERGQQLLGTGALAGVLRQYGITPETYAAATNGERVEGDLTIAPDNALAPVSDGADTIAYADLAGDIDGGALPPEVGAPESAVEPRLDSDPFVMGEPIGDTPDDLGGGTEAEPELALVEPATQSTPRTFGGPPAGMQYRSMAAISRDLHLADLPALRNTILSMAKSGELSYEDQQRAMALSGSRNLSPIAGAEILSRFVTKYPHMLDDAGVQLLDKYEGLLFEPVKETKAPPTVRSVAAPRPPKPAVTEAQEAPEPPRQTLRPTFGGPPPIIPKPAVVSPSHLAPHLAPDVEPDVEPYFDTEPPPMIHPSFAPVATAAIATDEAAPPIIRRHEPVLPPKKPTRKPAPASSAQLALFNNPKRGAAFHFAAFSVDKNGRITGAADYADDVPELRVMAIEAGDKLYAGEAARYMLVRDKMLLACCGDDPEEVAELRRLQRDHGGKIMRNDPAPAPQPDDFDHDHIYANGPRTRSAGEHVGRGARAAWQHARDFGAGVWSGVKGR